jgi:putative transposase
MQNNENNKDIKWYLSQPMDLQISMFNHYIDLMKIMANNFLQEEVKQKTGDWYQRDRPESGRYSRWGSNPGSIRVGEEKVPIRVPRIYDKKNNNTSSPEIYEKLKADLPTPEVMKKILLGISQKDYEEVVKQGAESFGLSQSSISRAFIEETGKALQAFENRDLRYYDFIALVIDGKYLARDAMIIALGITSNGTKIPIGIIHSGSENKEAIKGLLDNLISRNFRYDQGILAIVDGSKALSSAVKEVFEGFVIIQRCQWHKRENVLSYLNESQKKYYRVRLQMAYDKKDYHSAKTELINLINELDRVNRSAARSLREGLEETLTIHRLGFAELGHSFTTTNTLENINHLIMKHIGRVKNWKNSYMKLRWMAAALLMVEKKLRRVDNYHKLDLLRTGIKTVLKLQKEMVA